MSLNEIPSTDDAPEPSEEAPEPSEEAPEKEKEKEEDSGPSESSESEEDQTSMKLIEEIVTSEGKMQDPNCPTVGKNIAKAVMKDTVGKGIDEAFLETVDIAERGYVTRLRPETDFIERPTTSQYQIRPALENKFKAMSVKEMIHNILNDELGDKEYSEEEAAGWTKTIANVVRMKVKDMGLPRYKFVVQVVIGEEHGAGVKIGSRCLWDADTDNYASAVFLNDSLFCMTAVYAIYFY